MWRESTEWDYEDEQQSRSYPRLSGSARPRSHSPRESLIPELSQLSDEEFHQRLLAMRRKHAETMALCDEIGLHECENQEEKHSNHMPIATVDPDYTMSTARHGHLTPRQNADFVRRSFRSSNSPPTTRRTPWHESGQLNENTRNLKARKLEAVRRQGDVEENMRMYNMQKYMDENVDFDGDRNWDSCSADGFRPRPPSAAHPDHTFIHNSRDVTMNHYAHKRFSPLPIRSHSAHNNQWQNTITIPKPFNMTIREDSNPREKSKTVKEFEYQNAVRRQKEEWDRRYKFKALPLPANTYQPMYEVLKEKSEHRRTGIHAQRKEMLTAMQDPFTFDDREKHKKIVKHQMMSGVENMERIEKVEGEFKAKPFPRKLFDESANERMRAEQERRQVEAEQRAEYMLRTSYLNPNMKKKLKGHVCSMTHPRPWERPPSGKTHGNGDIKNYQKYQRNSEDSNHCHCENHEPRSPSRSSDRLYSRPRSGKRVTYYDSGSDGELGGAARWPNTNLNSNHLSRSYTNLSSGGSSGYSSPSPTYRHTPVYRNQMTAEMEYQLEQFEAEERRRQQQRALGNIVTGAKVITTVIN